ncbi:MAG TPA: hypothetical protein VGO68_09435 [Pyrinomonadaceae bacterium]|jgi:hypothetical protein|nr:hypothetical protein [Pyrinomonadaceae bacterium]
MSRKLKSILAMLAFALLFTSAATALAQDLRIAPVNQDRGVRANVATLGCCKCLGGSNSLDLSTISSNSWTVNGSPVSFLTTTHPAWTLPTGPAQWISTLATGAASVAPGAYDYKLNFVVPNCSIAQQVTLSGSYGGDDNIQVFLDSNPVSPACSGWCFNAAHQPGGLNFTAPNVSAGNHTLIVKVKNDGGPSGMFINAKLSGACSSALTKSDR